ncbi:DNA replication complex GINS protein PSF1 [Microplitis demolitor]|uniref:DNA replication complex GINS protein PSF1 n=1 Tax=Microplitis demolitor TaxID=69319 RepID=UPI0004CCBD45|nr:DNA replication complex GINS protein PSF1 [Microplitis demolitor]XP_008556432.1 DNA replication complex GINS protein PSF1 [Microplitis demolitor]XP_053593677.1 DNA replication complex GINS protein PSF1 [Microplitis demolitor]
MFGKEALKLITELELSEDIKPFNENLVRKVMDEMQSLYEANLEDVNTTVSDSDDSASRYMSVQLRHAALNRNKRCLLAYVYNRMRRLRQARWEFGSILPPEISVNMLSLETQWFQAYNKSLATYMRSIGDNQGLNLTVDMVPPKSLYIEVRCLVDYGKFELDDGQVITLKENTHHLLPRAQCEPLVRQGILEHVNS